MKLPYLILSLLALATIFTVAAMRIADEKIIDADRHYQRTK